MGWAGCPAQVLEGLAGQGFSAPRGGAKETSPRTRLTPAPGPGGYSSQAEGQVGWESGNLRPKAGGGHQGALDTGLAGGRGRIHTWTLMGSKFPASRWGHRCLRKCSDYYGNAVPSSGLRLVAFRMPQRDSWEVMAQKRPPHSGSLGSHRPDSFFTFQQRGMSFVQTPI